MVAHAQCGKMTCFVCKILSGVVREVFCNAPQSCLKIITKGVVFDQKQSYKPTCFCNPFHTQPLPSQQGCKVAIEATNIGIENSKVFDITTIRL